MGVEYLFIRCFIFLFVLGILYFWVTLICMIGGSCHRYYFLLQQTQVHHDKPMFVTALHIFGCDKGMLVATKHLLRRNCICRNKRVCCDKSLVSVGILLSQQRMCFVLVVLLQQNYVCCCKTFVMTKMTLVAAPANDRYGVKGWQDIKTTHKNDTCGSSCQW